MVEVMVNDMYCHAKDRLDVIRVQDQGDNLDYFAIDLVAYLEVIMVSVADNFVVEVVGVAAAVVAVHNHDPRNKKINGSVFYKV